MSLAGRRLLTFCLFVSGAAALVLEVAWSRNLSLVLGNSHQGVATVVASMMTGLFLGSLGAARTLPRLTRLARAYGLVEVAVGAYAALTPLLFRLLPPVLAPLYALPGPAFSACRFLVVFAILLPACSGMGATLPLVTAALSRREPGDSRNSGGVGGRLYGVNTLGAFAGTLLGGFVLLPLLGLLRTTLLGGAAGLAVGTTVCLFSRGSLLREAERSEAPREGASPDRKVRWILPLYGVSGGLAMIYEITWTRVLSPIVGTSVYSFTLILAAILAGIGLGSLLLSTRVAARLEPARGFALGQALLAGAAFASTWGFKAFPDLMLGMASRNASSPGPFLIWQFALSGGIVLAPALILGGLFPFASRLLGRLEREAGAEVGRVYAWNTAGSILGSLAAGFLLVEELGSETTLVLASAASALLGLSALPLAGGKRFRWVTGTLAAALALGAPFLIPSWNPARMTFGISQILRRIREQGTGDRPADFFTGAGAAGSRVVFHREGKTSTVTVVRQWNLLWLRVDGKADASTLPDDMATQVLLGQIPFLFARDATDACVIGFGSGVTSHAVLTHPVRRVDDIEIERQVIEGARLFESVSFRPLHDPRSRLILDDARTALAYRPQAYDVIISEPSNPWMAGVNNLFTSEFFALVRRRLKPGGVFCQWVQSYEMSGATLQAILDTLGSSFPHVHLFAMRAGGDLILLASENPLALAPGAADLFREHPEVARDLARIGVRDLPDLALLYRRPIPRPGPGRSLNTDDGSLVQYRAPLDLLRGNQPDRSSLALSPPDLQRLFFPGLSERRALLEVGRAAGRRGALDLLRPVLEFLDREGPGAEASELRERATALEKEEESARQVEGLLATAETRMTSRDAPGALLALERARTLGLRLADHQYRAGAILAGQRRLAEAEKLFDEAAQDSSAFVHTYALAARGAVRYRLGRREEGISDILAAKALAPDEPLAYLLFALALSDAGENEAALREIREGLAVAPGDERLQKVLKRLSPAPASDPASAAPPPDKR